MYTYDLFIKAISKVFQKFMHFMGHLGVYGLVAYSQKIVYDSKNTDSIKYLKNDLETIYLIQS